MDDFILCDFNFEDNVGNLQLIDAFSTILYIIQI
jgi:hypothetical protein